MLSLNSFFNLFSYFKWRSPPSNYGKYIISKEGFIISFNKRNPFKLIKSRTDRAGYKSVRLCNNGKTKTYFIHRLIAETFLDNPQGKPFINHINGIKTDNTIENLEWVSHAENVQHAYDAGLINKSKSVIDNSTGRIFKSSKEASLYLGIKQSTLKGYLNGTIKKNPTSMKYLSAA